MAKHIKCKQNGEKLVNLSSKMAEKLKKAAKRIADGVTELPYVPKAIFNLAKIYKETTKKEKEEKIEEKLDKEPKEKETKTVKENKKKDEKVVADSAPTQKIEPVTPKVEETKEEKPVQPLPIIKGKSLSELFDNTAKENKEEDKEEPKIEVPAPQPVAEAEDVELAPTKKLEEPKGKTDEPDTTALDEMVNKYGDLTKFSSWDEYYNSFKEKERIAKIKAGELLDEADFLDIRLKEAKENIAINDAKEAQRKQERESLVTNSEDIKAQKETNAKERKELEARIAEIDKEQEALAKEGRKIKSQIRALDKESEKTNAHTEEMKKIVGEEPAHNKEDDKKAQLEKQVDQIMQGINNNVYSDNNEPKQIVEEKPSEIVPEPSVTDVTTAEPQTTEEKIAQMSNLANILDQAIKTRETEEPLVKSESNSDDIVSELDSLPNNEPTTFVSTNPDYPGIITTNGSDVSSAWKTSPITQSINNDEIDSVVFPEQPVEQAKTMKR